jgi:hypothetical protein
MAQLESGCGSAFRTSSRTRNLSRVASRFREISRDLRGEPRLLLFNISDLKMAALLQKLSRVTKEDFTND